MKQYFSFQWHITDDCAQRRRKAGRDLRRLSGQGDQRAPWQDQAGQFPSPHGDSGQLCFPGTAQHRGRPEADERFLRRADRHYVLCAEAVFIFGGRLRGRSGKHDAGGGRFGDRLLLYRAGLACVCRPLRAGSVEKMAYSYGSLRRDAARSGLSPRGRPAPHTQAKKGRPGSLYPGKMKTPC